MASSNVMEIVVTSGPDVGVRQPLAARLLVGRGADAGLQLTDLSVSRRHVEVEPCKGGARVTVLGRASSFAHGGRLCHEAVLGPGDRFVIGETSLTLVRGRQASVAADGEITKIEALLDDAAVEARGLAALFSLGEALEEARDRPAIDEAVRGWAARALAITAELKRGRALAQDDETSCRRLAADTWELILPLRGVETQFLRVVVEARSLGRELHRLLAVAARMISASLVALGRLERARESELDLRRMALGSATTFLGSTPEAERIAQLIPRLARSDVTTLIQGETGVGKSFLARIIHELSPRCDEPFRVVNCAAIPAELIESELFGHERGAFTGAHQRRMGAFEAAGRGTLLLDELGDLPLRSQPKLLRVLEERRFERVGSNEVLSLEARVLVATHRDLEAMVLEGSFRSDMYYRISALTVQVPALRDRVGDVPLLAERFLADMGPGLGRRVSQISSAALEALQAYPWPGNARELRNVLEHAVVLGDGDTIEVSDLPPRVAELARPSRLAAQEGMDVRLPMPLAVLERKAIAAALETCEGNRTRAAKLLGINRATLYKKLKSPASS